MQKFNFKSKGVIMALSIATAATVSSLAVNCGGSKTRGATEFAPDEIIVRLERTATATPVTPQDFIRLNQIGYYPNAPKVAVVVGGYEDALGVAEKTTFSVVRINDDGEREETVLRGELSDEIEWPLSGEHGRRADFTALNAEGKYVIVLGDDIGGNFVSHPFEIRENIFAQVANASLHTFYFQRCSHALYRDFAGIWERDAGHPDTAVIYHASSGRDAETDGTLRSPGGWYDAGDFGKYIVNSGITVGTLLAFYEMFPNYFGDGSLNIPEANNGVPDILDEARINIDWMRTMQDEDGGVYNKLTTLTFPGYIMPHEDEGERFAIGKSTTAALNFAAVMAMVGRVYAPFDSAFASESLEAAIRAWEWARANPNERFTNPEDVKTGEYGDAVFYDEFTWAAAELFISTRDEQFAEALAAMDLAYKMEPTWQNVHALAPLSLATIENDLDSQTLADVRASIIATADRWIDEIDANLYRIPQTNFIWGSNSNFANMGIGLIYAYKLTDDEKYLHAAMETADYLLGKNAVGISFMTAFGTRFAANPHHRQVVAATGIEHMSLTDQLKRQTICDGGIADEIVIPGFLVGGPNAGHQDTAHGVTYAYALPAKSYEDDYKSYASNEVAINWNAPSTFLLAAIDAILRDK